MLVFRTDIAATKYFFPQPENTITLLFTTRAWLDLTHLVRNQSRRFGVKNTVRLYELDNQRVCDDWVEDPEWIVYRLYGRLGTYRTTICRALTADDTDALVVPPPEILSYQEILLLRMSIIADLLDQQAPVTQAGYLILDSDVVLYRNVAARMAAMKADLVFQRELPCAEPDDLCVNGGVWWVSAHSRPARMIVRLALHYMHELHIPDQDALQHALARMRGAVIVRYLDPFLYPNGFVYNLDPRLKRSTVHLIHFNWSPTHFAKLERLADVGVLTLPAETKNTSRVRHHTNGFLVPRALPRVSEQMLARYWRAADEAWEPACCRFWREQINDERE